jgi:hypothetical protein
MCRATFRRAFCDALGDALSLYDSLGPLRFGRACRYANPPLRPLAPTHITDSPPPGSQHNSIGLARASLGTRRPPQPEAELTFHCQRHDPALSKSVVSRTCIMMVRVTGPGRASGALLRP